MARAKSKKIEYLTNNAFAVRLGISRAAVGVAVKDGRIIKTSKGINPNDPSNLYYAQNALKNKAIQKNGNSRKKLKKSTKAPKKPKKQPKKKGEKELQEVVGKALAKNPNMDVDLDELEQSIERLPFKAQADIKKIIEQVRMLILKREEKRRELIPRDIVRRLFSEVYSIEGTEMKTLGTKIAPDIAAACGVDDPEKIIQIDERIEKEVYKIMSHVKRKIDNSLRSWGAELLEGEAS